MPFCRLAKMQVTGHKSGKSSGHRATVNQQH